MIKRIISTYQTYMIRPMLYRCATKISIALVLALLWNRFINRGHLELVRDAFFVVGIFFFLRAWMQYLFMDGVRITRTSDDSKKKKKRHVTKDIVDYADEKIISFSELDDDEQHVCNLVGDVLCGLLFLIPSLVALVI